MAHFVVLGPGHPFDLGHAMGFDGVFKLRQKGFERFEDKVDRLVHGLIQFRTGQGAGFLVPLGDVELVVQRNQGGGH